MINRIEVISTKWNIAVVKIVSVTAVSDVMGAAFALGSAVRNATDFSAFDLEQRCMMV
jgi:hypothetical protein